MPRKQSKVDSGIASYRAWQKENKKLEAMGMYSAEYYVKRVEILEAKVKRLEAKLKLKRKGQA